MIVYHIEESILLGFKSKLKGSPVQFAKLDEAIRTGQFIRNSCLKYWLENKGITKNDLQKYCAYLAACGTVLDRDENAAINILVLAIEMLGDACCAGIHFPHNKRTRREKIRRGTPESTLMDSPTSAMLEKSCTVSWLEKPRREGYENPPRFSRGSVKKE